MFITVPVSPSILRQQRPGRLPRRPCPPVPDQPLCGPVVMSTLARSTSPVAHRLFASENRPGSSPHPLTLPLPTLARSLPRSFAAGHCDRCSAKHPVLFSFFPFHLPSSSSTPFSLFLPPRPSLNPPSTERPTSGQIHFCVVPSRIRVCVCRPSLTRRAVFPVWVLLCLWF